MKKVCFFKIKRRDAENGFEWYWEDLRPNEGPHISEVITSLYKAGYPMEFCNYDSVDSKIPIVVVIQVIDMNDVIFLDNLKKAFSLDSKKVFIDLTTYDFQDVEPEFYEFCRKECNKELYFISKNLLLEDDTLFFENSAFHVDMYIPNYIKEYKKINKWCEKFGKNYSGLFLSGHIRFHKIQLLNYLYENNLLDENFLWSSTDEFWEPESFGEFIPEHNVEEYRKFKILERIPNMHDYDLNDKFKYYNYSFQVNHMHYFNTYFEIIPETQFYHRPVGLRGTRATQKNWKSVSEKTLKALLMDHPFIMVGKSDILKILRDEYEFDFEMDGWMHEYDGIENDSDRMAAIQTKVKDILSMSKSDLHDLHYRYFKSKDNYPLFVNNFVNKPLSKIFNKL